MRVVLFLFLFAPLFILAQGTAALHKSHHVPVDKKLSQTWKTSLWSDEQKIYKGDALTTIGMPCGGVAAGQLVVRGDGTFGDWWIANNAHNTGYGLDTLMSFNTALGPWKVCYQTFTPMSYIEQGFALKVGANTYNLSKSDFDDISFIGEYPIAKINYASRKKKLPVQIDMDVFSPFIPLNARESATPGTVIRYKIKNTSGKQQEITLTGWLQNMVALELEMKDKLKINRKNRIIKKDGFTSVLMDIENPELAKHAYYGNISLTTLSPNGFGEENFKSSSSAKVGAVGTKVTLKAGEEKEIVFLLTWYFPNRPAEYEEGMNWTGAIPIAGPAIGNMYSNWYNNSTDVAEWLSANLDRLTKQTYKFHDSYYNNTSIPYWLAQRLMMPVSTLATETCQWWANDRFWAWEGVGSCWGVCTHVWNYEQAVAAFFPELNRNVREKTDLGVSFKEDGGIDARSGTGGILIDGHAGGILKAYREHLRSGDTTFLSRNWEKIRKATEYIINVDDADGLLEGKQANTYDIAFFGANTYVGSLYLAALKAASVMATQMQDTAFSRSCDVIFARGSKASVERLFNGEYFVQDVDLKVHPSYQYATGCLSDQLFGQTWAHMYGLGYIYPEQNVKSALRAVWKYNWATDVGVQTKIHHPERIYADAGEPGLLVCTWPTSQHLGEDGVRYRDEVWTGIEYQVATNMIYDGMIEEGLSLVKAVDERYNGTKHNPWNEIECGDHYARALASWGVMLALEGYTYDGPAKKIGFSPSVQKENFKGFFTAAEGWGNISQERKAGMQVNSVEVQHGRLPLKTFEIVLAGETKPTKVTLTHGNEAVKYKIVQSGEKLTLTFDEISLTEGEKLSIAVQ